MEPPPVYSSLSDNGLFFRTEQKKRSLWLSPFTARKEPKKFAIFHIISSCVFLFLAITVSAAFDSHRYSYPFTKPFLLFICVPPLPFFFLAFFGIKDSRPNFVLPLAVYMLLTSSAIMGFTVLSLFVFFLPAAFMIGHRDVAALFFLGWFLLGLVTVPLLYTSHAARLYLRVYADIRDENKNRVSEKKVPLIA